MNTHTPPPPSRPPQAVRAIGRCAVSLDKAAERCIKVLLELIQTKVNYVVQEAVVVIKVGGWVAGCGWGGGGCWTHVCAGVGWDRQEASWTARKE